MTDPLQELLSGKVLKALFDVYVNVMGEWFWAILFLMVSILVYGKTRNFTVTMIFTLISASMIFALVPSAAHTIIVILLALGLAAVFYRIFRRMYY